jgi:hypothetical protein
MRMIADRKLSVMPKEIPKPGMTRRAMMDKIPINNNQKPITYN